MSSKRKLFIGDKVLVAVNKTINCRTDVIGSIVFKCLCCKKKHVIHRKCGHRFCGWCGYLDTQKWANDTLSRLEEIKHHHVVFTLPRRLRGICKYSQKEVFNLMFECAHYAVLDWFKGKHNLKPGIVSVMHSFGSDLKYHPHVHMLVSAGGINEDKVLFELASSFLTRQRFLANKFRDRFIERFKQEVDKQNIIMSDALSIRNRFLGFLNKLGKEQWIVSIQKPLEDLLQIVGYVGRYTKRACISEYKIESIDNDHIHFWVNDYANSKRGEKPNKKLIKMHFVEFLDALFQHVPDKRFRMVRYAGMYNSHYLKKKKKQNDTRDTDKEYDPNKEEYVFDIESLFEHRKRSIKKTGKDPLICQQCNSPMVFDQILFRSYKQIIDDS